MKASIAITAGLAFGLSAITALRVRSELPAITAEFERDLRADHRDVASLLQPVFARTWRAEGRAAAQRLAEELDRARAFAGPPAAPGDMRAADRRASRPRLRWVEPRPDAPATHRTGSAGDAPPGAPAGADALASVRAGKLLGLVAAGADGQQWLYTYAPVPPPQPGQLAAVLEIAGSLAPAQAAAAAARDRILETALWTGLLCLLLGLALERWWTGRPLRRLAVLADRIGAGDLDARLPTRRRDEVGQLARHLALMAENLARARAAADQETTQRLCTLEPVRHADRMSSIGVLASGIAHELGTPLAVIAGRAQLVADGTIQGATVREYARSISHQADKMTQLIRRVLSFARGSQSATISGHDLNRLAEQAHSLLGPLAMGRRVNLLLKTAGQPVAIQANSVQFQQAITNLVLNALDAMPQGGVVELHTGVREATPPAHRDGGRGEYPYCEVIDQGSGISPDVLPHIFEPFFTTKPAGRGTGLGLAVSHGIVHEHGGWIEVDSSPGEGSRFTVYVPPGGADGGTRPHRR